MPKTEPDKSRARPDAEKVPLITKVGDWLEEQGYRQEYLMCQALGRAGIGAVTGRYLESKEGKPRELDVCGQKQLTRGAERYPHTFLWVIAECKYSTKPWVLLGNGAGPADNLSWFETPKSVNLFGDDARLAIKSLGEGAFADGWHFARQQEDAHAIVQANLKEAKEGVGKDERDMAFQSLQKITNAAWEIAEGAWWPNAKIHARIVVLPCLVVDGPLFWAHFDPGADRFVVKKVDFGRLSWSGCRDGTMVDVVHISSVDRYATAVARTFKGLEVALETIPWQENTPGWVY